MSITNDIRNVFTRRDNALNQLIVLNVLVFAVLIVLRAILRVSNADLYYIPVIKQFQLSSDLSVLARHPWTVLTYAFTHEGFFHIIFNMLNLYWFGLLVREYLGDRRLVSIYILGALAGAAVFLLSYNLLPLGGDLSTIFRPDTTMVGASAAVIAIVVAGATLLPDYTFMLLLLGPVKIKWIAAVMVLISVAGINGANIGGNIAHLGGALLGFVFIKQLQAGRDLGRPIQAIGNWFSNLTNRRPPMQASSTRRPTSATTTASGKLTKAPGQPNQDEVDLILDKISRSGYESLSKEEKQKLFQASQ